MNENIIKEMTGIVARVLQNDSIALHPDSTAKDIDGWDSLHHLLIIHAIEQHFGIKFTFREISSFKTTGDIAQLIQTKLQP